MSEGEREYELHTSGWNVDAEFSLHERTSG